MISCLFPRVFTNNRVQDLSSSNPIHFQLIIIIIIIISSSRSRSVPAYNRINMKKKKRKDRQILGSYQSVEKLWNMKVMMILIVDGALRIISKDLEKRRKELDIRERIKTIQTTALLRSIRILRKVLDT